MKILYVLSIVDEFNKVIKDFRGWVVDHYNNPIVWVAFFLIGLLVFQFTYSALQKEK